MKSYSTNQKTTVGKAKVSQPFFQKKSANPNSFFSSSLSSNLYPSAGKMHNNLPGNIQNNLTHSFGQDFSNVRIQKNDQMASRMNALAYTQGEQIHFAPGQFNPDTESGRNLIGHEFVHIVQQRSGKVNTTSVLGKGLPVNESKTLEKEADQLGKKAVKGEIISDYQSQSSLVRKSPGTVQSKKDVIQLAVNTWGGTWDTDRYDLRKDLDPFGVAQPGARGVDMSLKFTPNAMVDAEKIGLTQSVNTIDTNRVVSASPTVSGRSISSGDAIRVGGQSDEGVHIDRASTRNNPIYGSASLGARAGLDTTAMSNNRTGNPTQMGVTGGGNATYQLGYRKKAGRSWIVQDAKLYDGPTVGSAEKNSKQIFETTALAIKGTQVGSYYGSVQWGWQTDNAGKHSKIPFKVVSEEVPSSSFLKAAELWNDSKDSGGNETADLPIVDVQVVTNNPISLNPPAPLRSISLPVGTRVQIIEEWHPPMLSDVLGIIKVVDGIYAGTVGEVSSGDWGNISDERP